MVDPLIDLATILSRLSWTKMSYVFGSGNHCRPASPSYVAVGAAQIIGGIRAGRRRAPKIAVLDDYQKVALSMADWSTLDGRTAITVFNDHVADPEAVVTRLEPFEIVCVMRERTPMTREIIERLPNLRLIASTAPAMPRSMSHGGRTRCSSVPYRLLVDADGRVDLGLNPRGCAASRNRDCRCTWRRLAADSWRRPRRPDTGTSRPRQYRQCRGSNRQGLRHETDRLEPKPHCRTRGCGRRRLVSKEELFRQADIVSIHLVLVDARAVLWGDRAGLMKPTARLVNTSRGPIVDEAALVNALRRAKLPVLPSTCSTRSRSHLITIPPTPERPGNAAYRLRGAGLYQRFYQDTVENIRKWLDARPLNGRRPSLGAHHGRTARR